VRSRGTLCSLASPQRPLKGVGSIPSVPGFLPSRTSNASGIVWELRTTEQMNLQCRIDLATKYKAGPQIRVHLRASNPPRTSFLARAPSGSAPVAASIALHDGSAEAAGVARAPPPASCLNFVRRINKGPAVWRTRASAPHKPSYNRSYCRSSRTGSSFRCGS